MDHRVSDPLRPFRLRPMRSARVSEISEATAASPVPPQERVNLHIGNPLQDERLRSMCLGIALGEGNSSGLSAEDPKRKLLERLIQKSVPYAPRGGYSSKDPDPLVQSFTAWLENQQEALTYDLGQESGRREVVLATGGITETLRVLFHALSRFLVETPAQIALFRLPLPEELKNFPCLQFHELATDEKTASEQVERIAQADPGRPTFVILGEIPGEETRRGLRALSLEFPLFFIEANDAPNHLSLAREAKLVQRVVRFLTPGIFSRRLKWVATVFVAGNADLLRVFESVHFELKGSPSASEIELLSFLLKHAPPGEAEEASAIVPELAAATFQGFGWNLAAEGRLPEVAEVAEERIERFLESGAARVNRMVSRFSEKAGEVSRRLGESMGASAALSGFDEFALQGAGEFLEALLNEAGSPEWREALLASYLGAFVKHQSQYRLKDCLVVSGSARTALGLLGFHCGLSEVIIPDLSWSYEHCFPVLHAVPLLPGFELDGNGLVQEVERQLAADPTWKERGAVVLNNPHNATGRVFDEKTVERLVERLLSRDIFVIDDLSYQNVGPLSEMPEIKTLRQHATELARSGRIREEQADRVITVHSLSKTDCLAGARLSVVEVRHAELKKKLRRWNSFILPNTGAIGLSYLFYRGPAEAVRGYWTLRNRLFRERSNALLEAMANLPKDRNHFGISLTAPTGSMYPLLQVKRLPSGLSLDWLASGLARQGIGMLPLATFARTEQGFEAGRTTFRLTLGGSDGADVLFKKMRRVLIDLNHRLADEAATYSRRMLPMKENPGPGDAELTRRWKEVALRIEKQCRHQRRAGSEASPDFQKFMGTYLPERLQHFERRLLERARITGELVRQARLDGGKRLAQTLEKELFKDSIARRDQEFRTRIYDRTVHPTQMFSIETERMFEWIRASLSQGLDPSSEPTDAQISVMARELWREFLGLNVAISSRDEAEEIILDLDTLCAAEHYAELFSEERLPSLISFWSDWDGSNRPSGQGHRLVAAVVMENLNRMAHLLRLVRKAYGNEKLDPELLTILDGLPQRNHRFSALLDEITQLTHQLERRYRGILPFPAKTHPWRKLAMKLRLRGDPSKALFEHNDRFERKMLDLRLHRRQMLEEYFSLNKRLRKQLHSLIPLICANPENEELITAAAGYRDLLKRVAITPRIQQGQITAKDQFAIDTTVHNLFEINEIAGHYGNPGMVLGLQISLSSKAEAVIALDRKMAARRDHLLRQNPGTELPAIPLIPLFEDLEAVKGIPAYLDKVWDYASQSRRGNQEVKDRFAEVLSEVFIAGSDLSQQIGQAPAAAMYRQAKYHVESWLAERHLTESVRMKLGSGEPMQRQGGYYSPVAGRPAFSDSLEAQRRYVRNLPAAARKSTQHAVTPLVGLLAGGDLRTVQSNVAEQLRRLPVQELVDLFYHLKEEQHRHRNDLIRAAESMVESRLRMKKRSAQELERLTLGTREPLYEQFMPVLTENFRQVLYGREEDVIGIHVISYFIARSMPQLRDRPTVRRTIGAGAERGQKILARLAETIPQSKQGSMLRAIAHNQAQTAILGVNQLTTGLFRALDRYSRKMFAEGEREAMISERLLPHLPVYEILNTLRLYHDPEEVYVKRIEAAFPAANSAFLALREDLDALHAFLPLFQQELLRRHGVDVGKFFVDGKFIPDLLPTLRPDLAVVLQPDLFNTSSDQLLQGVTGRIEEGWKREVEACLRIPEEIRHWRKLAWDVLEESVFERVRIFGELALAVHALPPSGRFFNGETEGEAPVTIIRALHEVKRIAQIEEDALSSRKVDLLRHYQMQIARLAGDNG